LDSMKNLLEKRLRSFLMLVFSSSNTSDEKVLIFNCFGLFLNKKFWFFFVFEGLWRNSRMAIYRRGFLQATNWNSPLCWRQGKFFGIEFDFSFSLLFHFMKLIINLLPNYIDIL
jgi:hypothetical protein